jgi:hypothetical protein
MRDLLKILISQSKLTVERRPDGSWHLSAVGPIAVVGVIIVALIYIGLHH